MASQNGNGALGHRAPERSGEQEQELRRQLGSSRETELQRQIASLHEALEASRTQLAAALIEKNDSEARFEARLEANEELFLARNAELARYQAELEAANDRLRSLVVTDDLTGLHNRRAFEERLTFEFSMARRKRRHVSVVLLDADDFKKINDQLGHPAGDSVLQQISAALQECVRLTDLAVRFGGEEFAVILPESDETSALMWCRRMRRTLSAVQWEHAPVTVSMGAAGLTPACIDGNHLVALADQALYRAKHRGKNCAVGAAEIHISQAV